MEIIQALIVLLSVFTLSQCQKCGMPDPETRIVGGSAAKKHQYPWMVLMRVRYRAGMSMMEAQCGASIINDQWAVTAAHCFEQPEGAKLDSVNLAVGKQYSKQHESDELDLKAQRVIVNKNFDKKSMKNDIAMVKFDKKLDFKKLGVKPICLPSANGLNNVDKDKCMASGWGKTQAGGQTSNELRQVNLKILADSTCKASWRTYYDDHKVCAGGVSGQDACQGDSGGPLQCPNSNGQFVLTGIVSFGQVCGTTTPGVYTRVDKYVSWINTVIKSA